MLGLWSTYLRALLVKGLLVPLNFCALEATGVSPPFPNPLCTHPALPAAASIDGIDIFLLNFPRGYICVPFVNHLVPKMSFLFKMWANVCQFVMYA